MTLSVLNEKSPYQILFSLDKSELSNFHIVRRTICNQIDEFQFGRSFARECYPIFRGVEYSRLDTILENGIDVLPIDSVIYAADDPCKAMEYGWQDSEQKMIVLMYDATFLKSTFIDLPADTPTEEVNTLMETYSTKEYSVDGSRIWLSRLAEGDKRRCTSYEIAYARWIPSNHFEALKGIIFIGRFDNDELNELQRNLNENSWY